MCVVLCVCTVEKVRGGSVCCAVCVYSGEGEGWECGECVLCCVCTVEKVRGGSVVSVCCAVCVQWRR